MSKAMRTTVSAWGLVALAAALLIGVFPVGETFAAEVRSTIVGVARNGSSQVNLEPFVNEFTDQVVSLDETFEFNGLDGSGADATMSFNVQGQAQSDFGVLRGSLNTSINNAFFNPANDAFDPDTFTGTPTALGAQTNARYLDEIDVQGDSPIDHIRLELRITGDVSESPGAYPFSSGYINLRQTFAPSPNANVTVPGSRVELFTNGPVDLTLTSDPFPLVGETYKVELILQLVSDWIIAGSSGSQLLPDGSNVSNAADLFSTIQITDVLAFSDSGAPVNITSAMGASGADYLTMGNAPAGDYDDSGQVEQGDLDLVLQNWGAGFAGVPGTWVNERPNSGIVDQAELDGVLLNWGNTSSPRFDGSAVPEPAALGVCVLSWFVANRRRGVGSSI